MRSIRLLLFLAFLGVLACEGPTVPKYPDPEDEEGDPTGDPDKPKGGFLLEDLGVYWA